MPSAGMSCLRCWAPLLPKALPVQAYITYLSPDLLQRPLAMAMFGVILMLSVLMAALYSIGIRRLIKRLGGEA